MSSCLSAAVLVFLGCSDLGEVLPPDAGPPQFTATFSSIQIEDSEILRSTYSSYKMPQGFYQEDLQGGSPYYENTASIMPLNARQPPFFELSTNNREEALAWSESSSVHGAYYWYLVSERETDQFFEFRRMGEQYPGGIRLSRVHKLSYLDRSMCDWSHPSPLIGRLTAQPLTVPAVRRLTEYFWFLENYNGFRMKALATVPDSTRDTIYCALYHLYFVGGDFGVHDMISLRRTVYAASRADGNIVVRSYTLHEVQGHLN